MKIRKYPQSCILLEYKGKKILIDPGTYVYEQMNIKPNDWGKIDILLLTHEHSDHTMPEAIKIIVKENNPIILTNKSTYDLLEQKGIKSEILEPNQEKNIDDIKITGTKQKHGPLPSGDPAPDVIGFLIDDKLYHPGDTIYLENKPYADVVCVPICGTVVMNPEEAAKFTKEINPKLIIPIHYSNPKYPTETDTFEKEAKKLGLNYKVLKNGESIEI